MKAFLVMLVFMALVLLNSKVAYAQCTEAKDADMAKYGRLTETKDAQGCSQCAMLAMYFCSARHTITAEDKQKVSSLINACKNNIKTMGQPYCCPELLNRQPQWGISAAGSQQGASQADAKQQRDQAIMDLTESAIQIASDIADDINASRERKAREKLEQRRLDSLRHEQEIEERISEDTRQLNSFVAQHLEKARNGDRDAQLKIIAENIRIKGKSARVYNTWELEYTKWLDEAIAQKQPTAILFKAFTEAYDNNLKLALYKKAAELGSLDALVILGEYYNDKRGGNKADSAFYWLDLAATSGCPRANYLLGMIYRYGHTAGHLYYPITSERGTFLREFVVTHSIPKNEEKALQLFTVGAIRDNKMIFEVHQLSLFAATVKEEVLAEEEKGSRPAKEVLIELADMYKKGIATKKDTKTAERLLELYNRY